MSVITYFNLLLHRKLESGDEVLRSVAVMSLVRLLYLWVALICRDDTRLLFEYLCPEYIAECTERREVTHYKDTFGLSGAGPKCLRSNAGVQCIPYKKLSFLFCFFKNVSIYSIRCNLRDVSESWVV